MGDTGNYVCGVYMSTDRRHNEGQMRDTHVASLSLSFQGTIPKALIISASFKKSSFGHTKNC